MDYKFKTYKGIVGFPRASFILMNLLLIIMVRADMDIDLYYIPTTLFVIALLMVGYLELYPIKDEDKKYLDKSQLQQYNVYRNKLSPNKFEVENRNIKLYIQILMFLGAIVYFLIKYM